MHPGKLAAFIASFIGSDEEQQPENPAHIVLRKQHTDCIIVELFAPSNYPGCLLPLIYCEITTMKFAGARDTLWDAPPNQGDRERVEKVLLRGKSGTPHDFRLFLMRYKARFEAVRHRHNFDQIRLTLSGLQQFERAGRIGAGEVGLFPEGVPYGPHIVTPGSVVLTLAYGGASGTGILSREQIEKAAAAMKHFGRFEGGYFVPADGAKPRTGYEAMWEFVNGKPLRFPEPQYSTPLIMHSDRFGWRPVADQPCVEERVLGSFTDIDIGISFVRIAAGAIHRVSGHSVLYVVNGEGDGVEQWTSETAMEVEAGEALDLKARAPTEIFAIRLP